MTTPDFWIDRAEPDDEAAIEALLDTCFGADRLTKTSYRYRDAVAPVPELLLVARRAAGVIGTVRCWPIAIGSNFAPALLLGPLAVDPADRGRGIATALMRRALDLATGAGHNLVLLVGDAAFYRAFDFVPAAPFGISMPDEMPGRLLVKELLPRALDGVSGTITRWGWSRGAAERAA
ncbi:MAG: N-acetyltransferase [Proteobacteria bacterium]|nr:N-acetyltransferase [Pseudomonadota bacterium]